jgi:hypothetical protein
MPVVSSMHIDTQTEVHKTWSLTDITAAAAGTAKPLQGNSGNGGTMP